MVQPVVNIVGGIVSVFALLPSVVPSSQFFVITSIYLLEFTDSISYVNKDREISMMAMILTLSDREETKVLKS